MMNGTTERRGKMFSDRERWWGVGSILIVELLTIIFSILLLLFDQDPLLKLLWCFGSCLLFIVIVCSIIYFVARKRERNERNKI